MRTKRSVLVLGIILTCSLFLPEQLKEDLKSLDTNNDEDFLNLSGHYISISKMEKLEIAYSDMSPIMKNVSSISGSVWDLKEFDDDYVDMVINNHSFVQFAFQLAYISEDISEIEYVNISFAMKVNVSILFMLEYKNQNTGIFTPFTLHNQINANTWMNWSVDFINTTSAPVGGWDTVEEPFVCIHNGMYMIRFRLPYQWKDEDINVCLDNIHSNVLVNKSIYVQDIDEEEDNDDDDEKDKKKDEDEREDDTFFLLGFFGGSVALDGRLSIILAFVVSFIYYDSVQKIKRRKIKR